MLDNIKLGKKLIGGFLAVALLTALVGFAGVQGIHKADSMLNDMYARTVVPLGYLGEYTGKFQEARAFLFTALVRPPAERGAFKKLYDENYAELVSIEEKYKATYHGEEDRAV